MIHEALAEGTALYVCRVTPSGAESPPAPATRPPSAADAARALARLEATSTDLRGCAVLDREGHALAASGEAESWGAAGTALLGAADAAGGEPASSVHVATEDGEAFAVREGDLAIVAVTARFTLASLVLFDMRVALRDLAAGRAGIDRSAPGPGPVESSENGASG